MNYMDNVMKLCKQLQGETGKAGVEKATKKLKFKNHWQNAYHDRLREMGYSSLLIGETTDGYKEFVLDSYNNA